MILLIAHKKREKLKISLVFYFYMYYIQKNIDIQTEINLNLSILPDMKMNWHYIMILKFMVFHAFHSQLPKF